MNKLNRLHIRGFRRLKDLDLEIRPMMVMIGANGVGKTSVLDAISLLSTSASGNLSDKLSAQGGISSVLTRGEAQSPSLSTVTMIDEPEVSLHPELLSLLADLMREASSRTQLIVATHSDRFIRFLEPKEVVVLDTTEEGYTQARWADNLDIEKWLADYSLDEIWRMGRMGGRL